MKEQSPRVVIVGLHVPFFQLAGFLVKLLIAMIPAAIIAALFWFLMVGLFSAIVALARTL